jgi:hypothetical protein
MISLWESASHSDANGQTAGDPHGSRRFTSRRLLVYLLNVWLVFHLAAIIIAPASVSPSSEMVQSAWRVVRPYLQLLYLNHGYHYFAPEPAESTLLTYTVELDDGTTFSGRIPHRRIHPRLLYHRHFMLTEFLNFPPPDQQQVWHRSYARHLCRKYGAAKVSLSRITHYLPQRRAVLAGAKLDDPASYTEEPLGTYQCDSF